MQKFLTQILKSPVALFNLTDFLEPGGYSGQKLAIRACQILKNWQRLVMMIVSATSRLACWLSVRHTRSVERKPFGLASNPLRSMSRAIEASEMTPLFTPGNMWPSR